ncbi:MAG: D-alanyl-D-alanine endopeptidase [Gammaproteobacteria bacterium]|nr:D-alanyl-D-alanine endopeptidase [Gammaproteobacteria bacterium]
MSAGWWLAILMVCSSAGAGFDQRDATALALASVHAHVVALDTGETLYAKHAETAAPIASITKLMTALVVLESAADLDEWLPIVERDRAAPANAWSRLRIGSEARRRDLLRIALMSSENLAAHLLGRHHPDGYAAFVATMNERARELGMTATRFVDTTGLSSDNTSTAADLTHLLAESWKYPLLREYSVTTNFQVQFRNPSYSLPYGNTNRLTRNGRWDVGLSKTGYLNAAGRCLVMITEIDSRPVAVVLLNSFGTHTPLGDAGRIRRWLETGDGGRIAGPALEYERSQVAACCSAPEQVAVEE